jgi:hypothetical protein
MAGKTPGTPRKSSSKKTASKATKSVTPINQAETAAKQEIVASEVEINTAEKTITPISQGNGKAEAAKYDSIHPGVYEEIRRRAYELYEERGRQHGFHHDDWSRAEREVLSRFEREKSA